MTRFLCAFLLCAHASAVGGDSPVTKVVKLLQEMLETSKSDGVADRTNYAKFKCYCDTETDEKTKSIANATDHIEQMAATLADRRAQNEMYSQEIFDLANSMSDNKDERDEAWTLRNNENSDFRTEQTDLVTGIAQLNRAIKLLQAVGADQTISTGAANQQMMGQSTSYEGDDAFLQKKAMVAPKGKLSDEAKEALRAASVFLSSSQRKKVTSFLSGASAAPGNYNSQSGEIVGVLKNMNDTFTQNLANARTEEKKSLEEHTEFITTKSAEYAAMNKLSNADKVILGNNAAEIAKTDSEKSTLEGEVSDNNDFLAALKTRCDSKKAEYEKRNMLRANEEAAIAQAISILNSDSSFDTFSATGVQASRVDSVRANSFVQTSFLQTSSVTEHKAEAKMARMQAIKGLLSVAKSTKSLRLARAVSELAAVNPFEEVIKSIGDMISLIDKEETADQEKKSWCETERSEKNGNKADSQADVATLTTNIDNLEISATQSNTNIEQANEDLVSNLASQKEETDARKEAHGNFQENLSNLQNADKILGKAIEVLSKYYDFLKRSSGPHRYAKKAGKDSGGSNIRQIDLADCTGPDCVDEIKQACSDEPACMGFNTAGWLKSTIADSADWYAWDGGDLYVKEFTSFVQDDKPETVKSGPTLNDGQADDGNAAINMLEYIQTETQNSADTAMQGEKTNQMQYEANMKSLKESEDGLKTAIDQYDLDLANTNKRLEEAKENRASVKSDLKATKAYLLEIKPGCDYIVANYNTRKQARSTEKGALQGAQATLKSSPAFTNYEDDQESEDLGECTDICDGKKDTNTAECQACINAVTVSGYCIQNGSTPGCDSVGDTGSADAMNAQ